MEEQELYPEQLGVGARIRYCLWSVYLWPFHPVKSDSVPNDTGRKGLGPATELYPQPSRSCHAELSL